jgi:dinuclear metal center YbgI/SA1388 family protein
MRFIVVAMRVSDLVTAMGEIAPLELAAPWDNVGLLVGDPDAPLTRLLLAVDCTSPVLDEACHAGCDALIAYHPVIFAPAKQFVVGCLAYAAARAGLSVYSPHTALDAARGGTNDVLSDLLDVTERRPLHVEATSSVAAPGGCGLGRVGVVAPAPLGEVVRRLKRVLGAAHLLVAGSLDRIVRRVAVCAGSGGEFIGDAVAAGADLLLTGEMRHHDALRALSTGLAVVCTLHSVSERPALAALGRMLETRLPGVSVVRSVSDRDPFDIC